MRTLFIIVIVSLFYVVLGGSNILLNKETHIPAGSEHFLTFKNQPLHNFVYLWSYISIEITSSTEVSINYIIQNVEK